MSTNLQLSTTGFTGKVYNKLAAPTSIFAWRITFPDETPLSIIPEENFYITDSANVIFDFLIRIEKKTNSVVITPKDLYDANVYYFLHIKKFRHGSGKYEKNLPPIHVGFKILDDDKLDLIWLKGAFDPDTVMDKASKVRERKATSIKQEYLGRVTYVYNTLPLKIITILNYLEMLVFGTLVSAIGLSDQDADSVHMIVAAVFLVGYIVQLIMTSAEFRGAKKSSVEQYNIGIANFNIGNYQVAENYLSDAIVSYPNNEEAEKALEINRKYLTKDRGKLLKEETYLERMKFNYNKVLLVGSGVIGGLYCIMTIFNLLQLVSAANESVAYYLKILFMTVMVLHFVFTYIQSKSYEFKSVESYNKGVDIFEEGDLEGAMTNFRLSLKYNNKNARAVAAKDLTSFIIAKERQKAEKEEMEAAAKALKEERAKELLNASNKETK